MPNSKTKLDSLIDANRSLPMSKRPFWNKPFIILSVIGLALLMAGIAWYLTRDPGPIKIAAVLPLTGPLALFGESERVALLQAIAKVNDPSANNGKPGINGRKVELIIEDSRGSARDGVSAVQKVLLQDPAAVITSLTLISNATQQVLMQEKTTQIALSVHPTIAAQSDYTIRPYYGFEQEMQVIVDYIKRKGFKRVGVLWVMVPECETAIDSILAPALAQHLIASESYTFADTNLRPQLTKIAASDPDAILVMDFGNLFGHILQEAETLGVRSKIIGNIGLLTAPSINPALLEGIVFAGPSFVINNSPAYSNFAQEFERQTTVKPTYDVLYTIDAFNMLIKALRESTDAAGAVNTEALRSKLRNIQRYEGVAGPIEIRNGSAFVEISLGIYTKGEVKPYLE